MLVNITELFDFFFGFIIEVYLLKGKALSF